MRILHLAPHCDEVGNGVVNVAIDLALKQREAGHAVAFVSRGGSMESMLTTNDVRHFRASIGMRRPWEIPSAMRALSSATQSFEPSIVHAHMVPGAVFARALQRSRDFRLISTVHNAPRPQATLMGLADRVIVVSGANLKSMARRGIARHKLRLVKNGPLGSPRRARVSTAMRTPVIRRPAIVTVARLFAQKGIGDLIAAFALIAASFPEWSLYLVGAGPEQERLRHQAADAGFSERIHFEGFVRDPRPYLAQADVFVLASRSDPFPLVIPEAREAGCAIIGTAVDGICEGLENGRAGLLVPPASPAALAKELARLLRDRDELAIWRERARTNLEWLKIERVVEETMAIYEEALADG